MSWLPPLLAFLVGAAIYLQLLRRRQTGRADAPETGAKPDAAAPPDASAAPTDPLAIAAGLREFYEQSAHPRDLLNHPDFERGVAALLESGRPTEDLRDYYIAGNPVIAAMALEALARRDDDAHIVDTILAAINDRSYWHRWFALRTLAACVEDVVGAVLTRVDESWLDPFLVGALAEFIERRIAVGEIPTFGDRLGTLDANRLSSLAELLQRLGERAPAELREELSEWRRSRLDSDALRAIGRVWGDDAAAAGRDVIEHPALVVCVEEVQRQLLREPARSVLLVGEAGVGKTAVVRALAGRLARDGVSVFEAGATELMAGMIFVGQVEERIRTLIEKLAGKDVVWYVPRFHELLWARRPRRAARAVAARVRPREEGRRRPRHRPPLSRGAIASRARQRARLAHGAARPRAGRRLRPAVKGGGDVPLTVLPLEPRHWDAVREIYRQGIAGGNATFETDPGDWETWDAAHLAECRFVAELDGRIVGWAALSPVSRRYVYRGVAEVSVYVADGARGRGVGFALLAAVIAESERLGFWTLQGGIFPENTASRALVRKHGFREVGVRERIGEMNGVWRDVVLVERRSRVIGMG